MLDSRVMALAALLAVVLPVAPVSATTVSIAVYNQVTNGRTMRWQRAPSGVGGQLYTVASGSSAPGSAKINFTFLQPLLAALGPLQASLTLTATSTVPAFSVASSLVQDSVAGQFSFTYTGAAPLLVGRTSYATGANLLSGTFSGARIIGGTGTGFGYFAAASGAAGETLGFASDFIDFSTASASDMVLSLSALTAPFTVSNARSGINSFTGTTGGSFGSDGAVLSATIPEPANWALMIGGFALLGVQLRRRRQPFQTA